MLVAVTKTVLTKTQCAGACPDDSDAKTEMNIEFQANIKLVSKNPFTCIYSMFCRKALVAEKMSANLNAVKIIINSAPNSCLFSNFNSEMVPISVNFY